MCEEICGNCLCRTYSEKRDKWICDNEDSDFYGLEAYYSFGCIEFSEREGADDR